MISFERFRSLFDSIRGEPEFELFFRNTDKTYMIIKYKDLVSFQRCGQYEGSKEYDYSSLMELYNTVSVDGICLRELWGNIETIITDASFDLSSPSELKEFKRVYIGS